MSRDSTQVAALRMMFDFLAAEIARKSNGDGPRIAATRCSQELLSGICQPRCDAAGNSCEGVLACCCDGAYGENMANSLQLTYRALVESYRTAAGERLGRLKQQNWRASQAFDVRSRNWPRRATNSNWKFLAGERAVRRLVATGRRLLLAPQQLDRRGRGHAVATLYPIDRSRMGFPPTTLRAVPARMHYLSTRLGIRRKSA
jgi:hypothetical protein